MTKYIEPITAGARLVYDRTTDCLINYWYSTPTENSIDEDDNDIMIELENKIVPYDVTGERIYPDDSYFVQYSYSFDAPTHIIDNIYLGSAHNALSYNILVGKEIKSIVNVTREISNWFPEHFNYVRYPIYDNNKESMSKHLENAHNDILCLQNSYDGNILVHCYMGRSRSALIVIYYLVKQHKMNPLDALQYVKQKRPVVNLTKRFIKDLIKICSQPDLNKSINLENIENNNEIYVN